MKIWDPVSRTMSPETDLETMTSLAAKTGMVTSPSLVPLLWTGFKDLKGWRIFDRDRLEKIKSDKDEPTMTVTWNQGKGKWVVERAGEFLDLCDVLIAYRPLNVGSSLAIHDQSQ
jgi:hypothetical protein